MTYSTRISNSSVLEGKPLIFCAPHFHRSSPRAIVAPMALARIKTLARAAGVAHENIGLLLFISGMKRHDFLFEALPRSGRPDSAFC
jgi:hypothetical protein